MPLSLDNLGDDAATCSPVAPPGQAQPCLSSPLSSWRSRGAIRHREARPPSLAARVCEAPPGLCPRRGVLDGEGSFDVTEDAGFKRPEATFRSYRPIQGYRILYSQCSLSACRHPLLIRRHSFIALSWAVDLVHCTAPHHPGGSRFFVVIAQVYRSLLRAGWPVRLPRLTLRPSATQTLSRI